MSDDPDQQRQRELTPGASEEVYLHKTAINIGAFYMCLKTKDMDFKFRIKQKIY